MPLAEIAQDREGVRREGRMTMQENAVKAEEFPTWPNAATFLG